MLEATLRSTKNLLLVGGLACLSFLLEGCYSPSVRDAPRPVFRSEIKSDTGWNKYIIDLNDRCERRLVEPLDDQETIFRQYIKWMGSIAGKEFKPTDFDIVSDNALKSFGENGFLGLFMPGGIFWYGGVRVRNGALTLGVLAHEEGHSTDVHINYLDYLLSKKAAARMDAVGESFEHYIGLELLRAGNENEGKALLMSCPLVSPTSSISYIVNHEDRYATAKVLSLVLMNDLKSMGKVWYFLAITKTDKVYAKIDEIIALKGTARTALDEGYKIAGLERDAVLEMLRASGGAQKK